MRTRDSYTRPPEIVLKQRYSETTGTTLWWLFGFVLTAPIVMIGYVVMVCYPDSGPVTEWSSWEPALSAYWDQLRERFSLGSIVQTAITLGISVPVLYGVAYVLPKQRLIISGGTLRWHVPVPEWLAFVKHGWSLDLKDVSRARLKSAPFASEAAVILELQTNERTRQLPPALWIEESAPADRPTLMGSWGMMRTRPNRSRVLETPLCAALLDAGVTIEGLEDRTHAGTGEGLTFDLDTNGATRVIAGLIVGLLCYGLADTMFYAEEYVTGPPLRWLVAVGLFSAAFGFVCLKNNEAPTLVSLTLSGLLGLMVAGASWPGILRVNAATDSRGLQTVTYYRVAGNRFEPLEDSSWPPVSLPEPAYWFFQEEGIERSVKIRQGGLGLYQVRLDDIRAEIRDYYRNR